MVMHTYLYVVIVIVPVFGWVAKFRAVLKRIESIDYLIT